LLQFSFHTVEYFLEGFSLDTGTAFWVTSDCRVYLADLGIFTNRQEEGKHVDSVFASRSFRDAIEDVLQKLELLL
jgi:hypothetical protein